MTTWTCFGNYKDLNFLLQGLLHSRFPKRGYKSPDGIPYHFSVWMLHLRRHSRRLLRLQRADGVQINTLKLPLFKLTRVRYPRHDRRGWSLPRVESDCISLKPYMQQSMQKDH